MKYLKIGRGLVTEDFRKKFNERVELRKLNDQLKQGIITQEEFDLQKKSLLAQILNRGIRSVM